MIFFISDGDRRREVVLQVRAPVGGRGRVRLLHRQVLGFERGGTPEGKRPRSSLPGNNFINDLFLK